ncbi:MAG TPA: undecaprenyl-diphosphatase UppP [Patescibacteria group bacterium]|nr:undecaprenyl-diphosphatase UppP [Patescibacteria group bacterium]
MDFFDVILLGIIEGLTEFLPVSSTGHLILASVLLNLPETEFLKTFQIAIQLGAILAVVTLYFRKLFLEWESMKRIIVALLPALGIGFVLYTSIRKLFESEITVVAALGIGGVILILFELLHTEKQGNTESIELLSYKKVFLIGVFQALSVIPGVSRAGATILSGLWLGLKRITIVEFSFLLAVPTMIGATALDIMKNTTSFSLTDVHMLLIGFITAFFVALVVIKYLVRFVQTHSFIGFGVYRIVVAVLFFLFVL